MQCINALGEQRNKYGTIDGDDSKVAKDKKFVVKKLRKILIDSSLANELN
jgi:hypothetical protein